MLSSIQSISLALSVQKTSLTIIEPKRPLVNPTAINQSATPKTVTKPRYVNGLLSAYRTEA